MPEVSLTAWATSLGLPGEAPVDAIVTVTYWAGLAPARRVAGDKVVFPATIAVQITDGVPSEPLILKPTGGLCCVRWRIDPVGLPNTLPLERYTEIPESATAVAFADLVDVDRNSYLPSEEAVAGWNAVLEDMRVLSATTVSAAGRAEAARAGMLVGGSVVGDALVLETVDGEQVSAGDVRGPQGERGEQGIQGIQGLQGIQGVPGPQGVKGETGPQGEVGATGFNFRDEWQVGIDYVNRDAVLYERSSWFAKGDPAMGEIPSQASPNWVPMSLQGPQGETGSQGAQGTQGVQGPVGPVGPQGVQGVQGPQGETGAQGVQGVQGTQGDLAPVTVATSVNGAQTVQGAMLPSTRRWLLSGNVTISFGSGFPGTSSGTITLVIVQAAAGAGPFTVTWPALTVLEWADGAPAPVMPTTAGARMIVQLLWDGARFRAFYVGTFVNG